MEHLSKIESLVHQRTGNSRFRRRSMKKPDGGSEFPESFSKISHEKGNPLARRYREEKKNEKEERDQVKANKRQAAVDKREKEYDALKDKSWEKEMMEKLGVPYIDPDESLQPATTQTGQTQMVQPTPV